ncbi:MAG: rod shape-determining protein MreC [Clostridia bacterium]|nr:rod shape-determining protein MreC [Clostridia bacterium]
MKKLIGSPKFKIISALLCAALLGVVLAASAAGGASPFSRAVSVVFTPLQKAAAFVSAQMSDFSASFVSSKYYQNAMKDMQDEIDELRAQLVDYADAKQKLASYENFLGVKEAHPDYTFAAGTVIARDGAELYDTLELDCGTADGVAAGDPVIFGNYLVGVVRQVRATSCVVETYLNPDVKVSVYEVRSREEGFASGTAALAKDGLCRMAGLSRDTAVSKGGIVATSGIGGIYPKDLILGTVTEVRDETADISSYAVIEPGIPMQTLTDAFVLIDFAGKGE